MSGAEVLPLVEGGKGISISNGFTAGSWAAAGGIGTFSGANADTYDEKGNLVRLIYRGKTRKERHEELVAHGILGGISQAKIAYDCAKGNGRIHMNVLWEMADVKRILYGVLEGAKGLIHGVTCGAGMPYDLAYIAAKFNVFYYPIVSSARAFSILWKRSYSNFSSWLGGVVYEDPWNAGGHNGLSRKEDPLIPQSSFERVMDLRKSMKEVGLHETPIIMAGTVWHLNEWKDWIGNKDLGNIAFQLGTRPLLTQESPIPDLWKKKLLDIKQGDVLLHNFSPTGFYSSAVKNEFLQDLVTRSERQVQFNLNRSEDFSEEISTGASKVFVSPNDHIKAQKWIREGFVQPMRTPSNTLIFTTREDAMSIRKDQVDCMGCLSQCKFSNWNQEEPSYNTGLLPDPRSFCIQKTLQDISHAHKIYIDGFSRYLSNEEIVNAMKNSEAAISQKMTEISTSDEKYLQHKPFDELNLKNQLIDKKFISYEQSILTDISEYEKDFANNLMFAGQTVSRFGTDPFYFENEKPKIPTVKELVDRICTGF